MDARHAVLFEPVTIGPKTLPNRFYQVPHATGFGSGRPRTQAAFRAVKAEGGWGGVCVEYAPVSPDSDEVPAIAAELWSAADARALALAAEAIHAHGSLAGLELFHGGAASPNGVSRSVRLAPSQVASELQWGGLAKEMTADDIARVQRDWVRAARFGADAGFDIVYVYGAHGYLMTQFLSAVTNRRADGYGGSLANRGRFWLETLAAVRSAVGADCAVATRIAVHGNSGVPGAEGLPGIEVDDMLALIAMADDLVDLWDVTVGTWPEDSGTSRYYPEGHQRVWAHRVREATAKPVVAVGRYSSPDLMAQVIRSGAVDLIGSARQAIADPFLPRKIAEGRLDEIRECTGSNLCILREETFRHVGCVQNATAGEEFRRGWHPEKFVPAAGGSRPVLIVGAGPAGLECAVVLGRRGFGAVHLVEAEPEIGGRLRWTRRLPGLGDWGRIIDWRAVQLDRLPGVEVITGRRLGAADVLGYGAELVIIATGSSWRGDGVQPGHASPMPGAGPSLPHVLTPEQVAVAGRRPPGRRVIVYDTDGYYVAPGVAELLAGEGYEVHVVTTFAVLSPVSDETLEGEMLRAHLHRAGVRVTHATTITAIEPAPAPAGGGGPVPGGGEPAGGGPAWSVNGYDRYGEAWSAGCDAVVLVTQQASDDALYQELASDPAALAAAGIGALYRIGDAVAPRLLPEAIFDGHRLAREIDSPDPAMPLPYLREHTGLG
ncbi:MAG TPA: FAD-dependent oxidoreductase [Streptosporangiaceae bacterium]|nr:FAD-dependent oxidoreductase [Streptosporangiaceae bacterium]